MELRTEISAAVPTIKTFFSRVNTDRKVYMYGTLQAGSHKTLGTH